MVPPQHLSPKILAALGLLGCEKTTACLSIAACLDYPPPQETGDPGDTGDTGDSGDTGDTGVGPCLDVAPEQTIIENHTADGTPAGPVVTGPKEAVTSVMDRGGLPDDIALRIQKNLKR